MRAWGAASVGSDETRALGGAGRRRYGNAASRRTKRSSGKACMLSGRTRSPWSALRQAHFTVLTRFSTTEFWVPLDTRTCWRPVWRIGSRYFHWLPVVARIKPGVTQKQVAAELATLAVRLAHDNPATDKNNTFVFEQAGSLLPQERGTIRHVHRRAHGGGVAGALIAGANVANLLFAQAASRQREMAVRLALGATRGRLRRQLLMESMLLGLGGGVIGVYSSCGPRGRSPRLNCQFRFPSMSTSAWIGACCFSPSS